MKRGERNAESRTPEAQSRKPKAGSPKAQGQRPPIRSASAPLPSALRPPPSAFRFPLSAFRFLAAVLLLSGCAGYRIGAESLYPGNIQTVYVPVFESDSFRRYLGERLTEAVIKEIELKTPYKVTGDSNADTILSGRITNESKRVLVLNKYHDPRDNEVSLRVKVRWLDRQSNLIRDGGTLPVPEELAAITETATAVPEVGQSIATAQQRAIQRLAEQIVGMMEAPW